MDAGRARRPRRPLDLRTALWDSIWLFAALRLGLTALAVVVWFAGSAPSPCQQELTRAGWTTFPAIESEGIGFVLLGQWQRWDACWYLKIATFGYEPGTSSVAFFPLLPALEAALSPLLLGSRLAAGLLVASVSYVVAVVGILRLVGGDLGRAVARRTALYLSIFPVAFFLFAPFTEALFLALAVWTLLSARDRRWKTVAIVAALAALTRPHGALLALPIAWEAWRQLRDGDDAGETPSLAPRRATAALVAVAAPIAAFAAFAVIATAITGESPMAAQGHWNTQFAAPWDVVVAAASYAGEKDNVVQAANLVTLLGASAILLVTARRLPVSYTLYAAPALLLIGTRMQDPQPLMSTMRYVLVLFPVFAGLALLGRDRRVSLAWQVASIIFLGYFAHLFLTGAFVG